MRVLPQDAPPAAILLAVLGSECCNRQAPRSPQQGRRERFSRRHPCSVPVVISDHGSGGNIDASAPVEVSVLAVAVPPLLCLTELLDQRRPQAPSLRSVLKRGLDHDKLRGRIDADPLAGFGRSARIGDAVPAAATAGKPYPEKAWPCPARDRSRQRVPSSHRSIASV